MKIPIPSLPLPQTKDSVISLHRSGLDDAADLSFGEKM
jgi:hypothetical protein